MRPNHRTRYRVRIRRPTMVVPSAENGRPDAGANRACPPYRFGRMRPTPDVSNMSKSTTLSASPVIVENVTKRFRQGNTIIDALKSPAHDRAGRVRGRDGGQWIGQEHLAARDGRPDAARRRTRPRRRPGPGGHAGPGTHAVSPPPHRTGLPGLQSDPHAHGPGQHPLAPLGRRAGRALRTTGSAICSRGSSWPIGCVIRPTL